MVTVRNVFLNIHIWTGFFALVLFWGIVFLKKGSLLHRKMGLIYFFSILMLFVSSFVNTLLVLRLPQVLRPELKVEFVYIYYSFLFLASHLCFTPSFIAIIVFFKNPETFRKLTQVAFCFVISQIFFAVAVSIYSLLQLNIFLFFFSTVFTVISVRRDYKSLNSLKLNAKTLLFSDKLKIHLKSVIAGAIALHIGFAAGGSSIRYFKSTNSPLYLILLTSFAFIFMWFFEKKIFDHMIEKYSTNSAHNPSSTS